MADVVKTMTEETKRAEVDTPQSSKAELGLFVLFFFANRLSKKLHPGYNETSRLNDDVIGSWVLN